jgi:hypothetical protein
MPAARFTVVRERRVFIAWQLVNGRPQILDAFRAEDVAASFTVGLSLTMVSNTSATKVTISTYPREIIPGVFAWIPPFADVRFGPTSDDPDSVWRLTVPMCTRVTDDRPGHPRLSTLKEFRDLWPDVTV